MGYPLAALAGKLRKLSMAIMLIIIRLKTLSGLMDFRFVYMMGLCYGGRDCDEKDNFSLRFG